MYATSQHNIDMLLCSLDGTSCYYGHKWDQLKQKCTSKYTYITREN